MSDEEQIRKLAFRVVHASDGDREAAITALKAAVVLYLEEQSDELLLSELQKTSRSHKVG